MRLLGSHVAPTLDDVLIATAGDVTVTPRIE